MNLPETDNDFTLKSSLLTALSLESCIGQAWKRQIVEECTICFEQTPTKKKLNSHSHSDPQTVKHNALHFCASRPGAVNVWGLLMPTEYAHIHLLLLNLPLIFMEVSENLSLKRKSFPAAVEVTHTYPGEKATRESTSKFQLIKFSSNSSKATAKSGRK